MSHIYLKVKIKNLAEEAKIIRREERIALKQRDRIPWAHTFNVETNDFDEEYLEEVAHYQKLFNGLHEHRKTTVRNEQRATHIAYAFIRGRPFGEIEHGPIGLTLFDQDYGPTNRFGFWSKIGRMIAKYGPKDLPTNNGFLDYQILRDWVAGQYICQKKADMGHGICGPPATPKEGGMGHPRVS